MGVIVKFPARLSLKKVGSFLNSKRSWIRQALERARATEQKSIDHYSSHGSTNHLDIRKSLITRLDQLALENGFTYNKVSIRDQKSRWGSCSARDNISLNQKLFFLPDQLRDYVLVHELAHTREKNHSPAFWELLFNIFGQLETRKMRQELKAFDYLFYPPPLDRMK